MDELVGVVKFCNDQHQWTGDSNECPTCGEPYAIGIADENFFKLTARYVMLVREKFVEATKKALDYYSKRSQSELGWQIGNPQRVEYDSLTIGYLLDVTVPAEDEGVVVLCLARLSSSESRYGPPIRVKWYERVSEEALVASEA